MRRILLLLTLAAFLVLPTTRIARAADDDDPMVGSTKKKVSDYVTLLKTDKDAKRRRGWLLVLVDIVGPKPRAVIPAVCDALRSDEDATVRAAAAQGLGSMFARAKELNLEMRVAVEALKVALAGDKADKEEAVREAAATALGKMGQDAYPAIDTLVLALKDKTAVQRAAADSLDRLGEVAAKSEEARAAMLALLKDKNAGNFPRLSAVSFLAKVLDPEKAVPILIEFLKNEPKPSPELHRAVLETLAHYGKAAAEAAPQFLAAFDKKNDPEVRFAALTGLVQIGPAAVVALPQVREALKDDDKFIRIQALEVLARLGKDNALGKDTPTIVDEIIQFLKREQNSDARVAAINALGEIGPAAKGAVDVLADAAKSPQQGVRDAATAALKKVQGE